jgi:hypothetical protein
VVSNLLWPEGLDLEQSGSQCGRQDCLPSEGIRMAGEEVALDVVGEMAVDETVVGEARHSRF